MDGREDVIPHIVNKAANQGQDGIVCVADKLLADNAVLCRLVAVTGSISEPELCSHVCPAVPGNESLVPHSLFAI